MRATPLLLTCTAFLIVVPDSLLAEAVPDALRTELRLLAGDVAKIIDKKGGGGVAIGEFGGSVEVVGHAGPNIQLVLAEELRTAGLTVDSTNHRFEISGRYQPFLDSPDNRAKGITDAKEAQKVRREATNLNAVKLVAFLIDKDTGEPLAERPTGRLIFGAETVPAMLGLNTSNGPVRDPKELSDNFDKASREPQVELQGTQIKGKTGLYAIELLVRQGGQYAARPVTMPKNQPFVNLNTSDIYAVRLINNSPHEAAVDLRIDGVNCFSFSKSESRYWIIAPHSQVDIVGWHRNNDVTTEFKVVSNFPETAAAHLNLKPSPSIGLITASFSASWEQDVDRPRDEPEVQGRGTGFGDDIQFKTKQVSRTIGQVRDNLSVRYEK